MDSRFAVNLQDYAVVPVTCPSCGLKYSVRLHRDYLASHKGKGIQVICVNCAKSKQNSEVN